MILINQTKLTNCSDVVNSYLSTECYSYNTTQNIAELLCKEIIYVFVIYL